MPVDIDAILAPPASGPPGGPDLRYQPVYDEIKTTKKLAETDPLDLIPWKKVVDLTSKSLTQSKDLQLAVWMLEPLARLEGFAGVSAGLVVLRRLLVEYWESLYPAIDPEEPDPAAFRRSLLEWIDKALPNVIKMIPLTAPPASYGLLHYEVTQKTGDERKALLDEGWPSGERFEEALQNSTLAHLEGTLSAILACEAELAALQTAADQRLNGPDTHGETLSFFHVRETLETGHWIVERPTKKKREAQGGSQPGGAGTPDGAVAAASGLDGDAVWNQALSLTRGSRVDGLLLLQAQVANAVGGRDRFLKQLQLGELCLEAGVHALAFPIFEELTQTIDTRKLEEWEDKPLITRVWTGLVRCCGLLESQIPSAAVRGREIQDRLAGLGSAPPAESPPQ